MPAGSLPAGGADDLGRALLFAASGREPDVEHRPVSSASVLSWSRAAQRQRYLLEERVAELELRLRERAGVDDVHELELRSMQHELDLRAAYVGRLEASQHALHLQIAALHAERAQFESAANARIAELSALLQAIQSRRAYRLTLALVSLVRPVLAPVRWARRRLRSG